MVRHPTNRVRRAPRSPSPGGVDDTCGALPQMTISSVVAGSWYMLSVGPYSVGNGAKVQLNVTVAAPPAPTPGSWQLPINIPSLPFTSETFTDSVSARGCCAVRRPASLHSGGAGGRWGGHASGAAPCGAAARAAQPDSSQARLPHSLCCTPWCCPACLQLYTGAGTHPLACGYLTNIRPAIVFRLACRGWRLCLSCAGHP